VLKLLNLSQLVGLKPVNDLQAEQNQEAASAQHTTCFHNWGAQITAPDHSILLQTNHPI
jgi:hypothetical protein